MRGLFATLVAVAALAAPAAALGAAETFTFTQHVEQTDFTANPCIGKGGGSVFFEGFIQQTLHVSTDDSGGQHVVNQIDFHLTGTSDAGTKYVLATASSHYSANATAGGATEYTFVTPIHFITTGRDTPTDDYNYQTVNHVTVDANGEVTSSTFEFRSVCQ
jgi:hypothetical protein